MARTLTAGNGILVTESAPLNQVIVSVRDVVHAKDLSVVGDGVSDDSTAMNSALTTVASGAKALDISGLTIKVGSDLRVPSNVVLFARPGTAKIVRASGAATYLIGNSDKSGGNANIVLYGIEFDGLRSGTTDIPQRWGGYFSNVTDLTVEACEFHSCDSDGLVFEFVNRGAMLKNRGRNNNKPSLYLSCCDRIDVTGNRLHTGVSASTTSLGLQVSSSWYCTVSGNSGVGHPFGGLLLSRDSRHNTFRGNVWDNIDTNPESMPAGYGTYLATVTRPGRTAADGATLSAAHDNRFIGDVVTYPSGAAGRVGVRLINSHRNTVSLCDIHDVPDAGIYLVGSTDSLVSENRISNCGQNASIWQKAVAGATFGGIACDRTRILANEIFDTQGVVTTRGIQINDAAAVGCEVLFNRVRLAANALTESGSTAPLRKWGNQFGTTAIANLTGWGDPTGTATRSTFATSTVTTEQLAQRMKGLIDDLKAAGVLHS